jgi:hypothetical protein
MSLTFFVRTHDLSLGAFYTLGVLTLFTPISQAWSALKAFYVCFSRLGACLTLFTPVQIWSVVYPWGVSQAFHACSH